MLQLVFLLISISFVYSYINPLRLFTNTYIKSSSNINKPTNDNNLVLNAQIGTFGSKLLPSYTEEELADLFKEFNITNFDFQNDPEILKWSPSKEFFEKFGFQNNTERYSRKVADVKKDFYSAYTKPILPQYKTFVADLLAVTSIQIVDSRYKYDAIHAFGLCTQYYTVMKGYPIQEEIDVIFNEFTKAVGLDGVKIRDDAKRILGLVKDTNLTEDDVLNATEGEIATIFQALRANRFFKYTDAWGVGLGRIMELIGVEPNATSFDKWGKNLRWVFSPRLVQTWDEFCADQLRMQGVESMQKQLLIREKKRAAARLEKKASEFDDKKKALIEINKLIEERRNELIEEQKVLKKKYEPDEYERILLESQNK